VTSAGVRDSQLMQRVALQDREAMAEVYDRYAARVYGLCLRILEEAQLAEDMLQEVFVRVWQRAYQYEPSRGSLMTWLMGVARNTCIDQLRRQRVRPQALQQPDSLDALPFEEGLVDPDGDVPGQADMNARAALVRRALARLTPEQQLVIHLSYFRGLTRREIARNLQWPEGTVHTRARLALQNLRRHLDELGLEPSELE
jgi:RNA polymerase sigma-70 factor, ECF subfamily